MDETTYEDAWLADDPLMVALRDLRPAGEDDERFAPDGLAAEDELARIMAIGGEAPAAALAIAPAQRFGPLGPFDRSATGPAPDKRHGARPRRRRAVTVALAAAAVVAAAVVVPLAQRSNGPTAPTRPVSHTGTAAGGGSAANGTGSAAKGNAFRLVDATSLFRAVGGGTESVQLDCVTETVCYEQSPEDTGPGSLWQRTTDGGVTWHSVASLGGNQYPELTSSSCSSADVCAAVPGNAPAPGASSIALTTDGGASWTEEPVQLPSNIPYAFVGAVSCVDASRCVVEIGEGSPPASSGSSTAASATTSGSASTGSSAPAGTSGTGLTTTTTLPPASPGSEQSPTGPVAFLSTTDGGATWSEASSTLQVPGGGVPTELRCDADGSCVAFWLSGNVAASSIVAIRSTDFGSTWTAETAESLGEVGGTYVPACGDASHCLVAYSQEGEAEVATTSDGGATWRLTSGPASWPDTPIAATCTGAACWLSISEANPPRGGGYADPVVEQTQDGGATWTPLAVPQSANGYRMGTILTLSCPDTDGCLAMGITQEGYAPPKPPASDSGDRAKINAEIAAELANADVLLSDLPAPVGSSQGPA